MKIGLNKEEKKEVMKQMKTDVKADFVDVIMETIKKRNNRRKVNDSSKFN